MTEHTFPVIEASGDAYQMGYEHGAQAKGLSQMRHAKPRGESVYLFLVFTIITLGTLSLEKVRNAT